MSLPVGLQLYSVRSETEKDFIGTLEKVAEIGYEGVEFAGYGNIPAEQMKAVLDRLGLKAVSSHVGLDVLEDNLDEAIEYSLTIGSKYIVYPWHAFSSREDFVETAKLLEVIGGKCAEKGIVLGYHNHDHEFVSFNGEYGLDILFANADPKLLATEIDTCWVYCAGVDPAEYVKKYTGRCPLIHIKDVRSKESKELTEVGTGAVDVPSVVRAAEAAGVEWLIVEQDECTLPPLESVKISFENLKKML